MFQHNQMSILDEKRARPFSFIVICLGFVFEFYTFFDIIV